MASHEEALFALALTKPATERAAFLDRQGARCGHDRRGPYFVMELVCGIRIADYCDQAQCSPADPACHAQSP